MSKSLKIAVTGAAGQIGYAFLFRLASGEIFGPDTKLHLSLLEIEKALPALEGVVMELQDCAFENVQRITATSSYQEAFEEADWAILTGSVPRKTGMERADLLKINGGIFIDQGKALDLYAKRTCKVLVVGNPCNTNCYIAKTAAKGLPSCNFFALMMLDQKRALAQAAIKAGVEVHDVKNIAAWGNHSSTQFPDFFHGTIQGQPINDVISDTDWLKNEYIEKIQKRGAEIIKARGQSSAASAANAIIETVKNLTYPTETGEFFSVAVSSDGSYGVEEGLIFGFPIHFDGKNWNIVQGIKHNDFAQEKIEITKKELLNERNEVEEIFF